MSPITHLLIGWMVANSTKLEQKERAAVTLAAVVPDLDGLGIIPEILTRNSEAPLIWYTQYHHVLGHNLFCAILASVVAFCIATSRWKTTLLVFLSFHLHLLGDVVGSRGSDGFQWPIYYFSPFSKSLPLVWEGQWVLNSWQNFTITLVVLTVTLYLAWRRGFSPIEIISKHGDRKFVETLRNRFFFDKLK